MKTKMKSATRHVLAAVLSVIMLLGMLPTGAFAEGTSEYGTVASYSGGTITGNNTASVEVLITEATIQKSVEKNSWYVGISVTAPENVDLSAATYKVSSDGGKNFGDPKSFEENKDGDRYIQLWFAVSPDSLRKFQSEGRNLAMAYEFDWNGKGDKNQTILFSLKPSSKIVLMEGETQVFPDPAYGQVETYTGGTIKNNNTKTVEVTITKTSVNWSASKQGWWVGINAIAPDGVTDAELQNATYRVNPGSGFGGDVKFADKRDTTRSIQLWFSISPESLEKFIAENRKPTMTYEFNWNGKGDNNQTIVFSLVPSDDIVLKKDGLQVYPENNDQYGTVDTYNGGTISNNNTTDVQVLIESAELEWVAKNDKHGEGWWVGICVTAPKNLTETALANATYKVSSDGGNTFSTPKSFVTNKDGERDIQLWFTINPDSLKTFIAQNRKPTMVYEFDWNGKGDFVQKIEFALKPSESVVLMKDGVKQFPYVIEFDAALESGTDTYGTFLDAEGNAIKDNKMLVALNDDVQYTFVVKSSHNKPGYKVVVLDNGNELEEATEYTIHVVQDHVITACVVDDAAPEIKDMFVETDGTNVTYSFTATDNESVAKVIASNATGETELVGDNGKYSVTTTADVSYDKVVAFDNRGNKIEVPLVNNAPAVTVVMVSVGYQPETYEFKMTVGGDDKFVITCDKALVNTTNEGNVYHFTVDKNGKYTFAIESDDWKVNTTVTINKIDKIAPSVNETVSRAPGADWTNRAVVISGQASDEGSGVDCVKYYSSANPADIKNATLDKSTGKYTINVPAAEFEGTYTIWAVDGVGRESNIVTTDQFGIDLTKPTVTVTYDNNEVMNEKYFNAPRKATIVITEAHLNTQQVVVSVNGKPYTVIWHSNGDKHTGYVTFAEDGKYTFNIEVTDKAGNKNGGVRYNGAAAPTDFVIDTTYENMITYSGVANGKAYGYDAALLPEIMISDINLEDYSVSLVGVQKDLVVDWTDTINAMLKEDGNTVTGKFDVFEVVQELDGIYTMVITASDKAGNQDSEEIVFTVNRFGSVYYYDEYLRDLIADGGKHVSSVDQDLVIMEYNADKLVEGSLQIEITVDGRPLENVKYTATPEINNTVEVGASGWYQYKYTISKDNFTADGIYKIAISSKDATGNTPENSNYENMVMNFYVDSTNAEITSIVGLEEPIINATEVAVKYTVFDTMGIKSVKIYVDDELVDEITDFSMDPNNYNGTFVLNERSDAQKVRIVVEDVAGNITDTDAETFSSAYVFNKSVTVSTNIFVRWYANKALFWGSIGGTAALIAAIWIVIVAMKKKKKEAVK